MSEAGLILVGGGGHSAVVADSLLARGGRVEAFLDDDDGARLDPGSGEIRHGGPIEAGGLAGRAWICCVGELSARAGLLERIGSAGTPTSVVHARAVVSSGASVGVGVFVGPGAIVNARARVGDHAILNSGCVVEHDVVVGVNAHVAPGAVLAGGVRVGSGTLVGLNATVLPGVVIGSGCRVGAGAVVVGDVADGVTVVGTPARLL